MKRRFLFLLLPSLAIAVACTKPADRLREIEERAGATALAYYDLLQKGKYHDFVLGMDGGDSLPTAYREQMEVNAAMFVKQQTDERRGIADITLQGCKADTVARTAEAMLTIVYADSTRETVCVPLVMRRDTWYMR